jgi:cytidyltransferase-like protein
MSGVTVYGTFAEIHSRLFRFLHEASRLGPVEVVLAPDGPVPPKFSLAERQYVLGALRYVDRVRVAAAPAGPDSLPDELCAGTTWVVDEAGDNAARRAFCRSRGLGYRVIRNAELAGFPEREADPLEPDRKTVIVTGCYDWFHSGHVRFFEEVAELGNLYVIVGHDANLRLLKGEGHPLFPEAERRYMVQSARRVKQAFISTGQGWMDAEPEIERLRPDAYAVNEDGDRPEKREFCRKHGLEYIVLKRTPKPGLTRRTSTDLRGF